jgi:hypothetical protein
MTYLCERRIRTLADNYVGVTPRSYPSFIHDGVKYENWNFTPADGATGNEWLASSQIEAISLIDAHSIFRKKLLFAVPKIALISQCYTEFLLQPLLIHRQDKDFAYFNNILNSPAVPLHFDDKSEKALVKLMKADINPEFFYYWNDATNTTGASPKLLLLFSAIEALCKKNGNFDKALRRSILGEVLDTKFFENGNKGLRHRLVHGDYFQQGDFDQDYTLLIHQKIVAYFNSIQFSEELITPDVTHPQRHFDDNKLQSTSFIKRVDGKANFNLRTILNAYDTKKHRFTGIYEELFDEDFVTY